MEHNSSILIAIGGEPASGKTTLIKRIRENYPQLIDYKKGLVRGKYCPVTNVYFIGVFDDTLFEGTDKLSLAVQPAFIEFVKSTSNAKIVFEGDRLFNASVFEKLKAVIFILNIDKDIHQERHNQRGNKQNEIFLRGRKTKIQNIKNLFTHKLLNNNTQVDIDSNEKEIMNILLMNNIGEEFISKRITKQ